MPMSCCRAFLIMRTIGTLWRMRGIGRAFAARGLPVASAATFEITRSVRAASARLRIGRWAPEECCSQILANHPRPALIRNIDWEVLDGGVVRSVGGPKRRSGYRLSATPSGELERTRTIRR